MIEEILNEKCEKKKRNRKSHEKYEKKKRNHKSPFEDKSLDRWVNTNFEWLGKGLTWNIYGTSRHTPSHSTVCVFIMLWCFGKVTIFVMVKLRRSYPVSLQMIKIILIIIIINLNHRMIASVSTTVNSLLHAWISGGNLVPVHIQVLNVKFLVVSTFHVNQTIMILYWNVFSPSAAHLNVSLAGPSRVKVVSYTTV